MRPVSQADVDVVNHMLDRYHAGDAEGALSCFSEDLHFDASARPDGGIMRGIPGMQRVIADWVGTFENYKDEILAIEDHGDHVLVSAVQRGVGKGSGVEIEQHYWTSYRVGDGKITAMKLHLDEGDARENHV